MANRIAEKAIASGENAKLEKVKAQSAHDECLSGHSHCYGACRTRRIDHGKRQIG